MLDQAEKKLVIAIDGPAGAGKSTIASRLARKFGYIHLESGAMYRALALKAIERDVGFEDEAALLDLAQRINIELQPRLDGNRVLLDTRDVSSRIRERDVTEAASKVSVHPRVREWMVAQQQKMGAQGGIVMEGRDIGTKVFPNADVKIFLEADPNVRMERRLKQREVAPEQAARIAEELRDRDHRDTTRAASPLIAAPDAVIVDSTHMSIEAVIQRAEELVREALEGRR